MSEQVGASTTDGPGTPRRGRRRRRYPDPLALIVGLVALAVAGTGYTGVLPASVVDPRWLLALVAVVAGALYLLAGLRNARHNSDE